MTHTAHALPLPGGATLALGPAPLVMGILNATPDSFSDGGEHFSPGAAVSGAQRMAMEGADLVDLGGESTRPGADPVGVQAELDRVMPVLDGLGEADFPLPVSIDTNKALVADQAAQAGAGIINDVRGLQGDPDMAAVAVLHDCAVIIMHWNQHREPTLPILDDMRAWFERSISIALDAGLTLDRIILDPGFGFGKTLAENYEILRRLPELMASLPALPWLIGTSRKSMIGRVLDVSPDQRVAGTIATSVLGYQAGAQIFRVHDVRPNRDALRIAAATLYGPVQQKG